MNRIISSSKLVFKAAVFSSREFSKFGRKPVVKRVLKSKSGNAVEKRLEDAWVSVKDESSGQVYWWNQISNETTALGEPKPTGPTAIQSYSGAPAPAASNTGGGMMSGIGGAVAHGMAFGAGSSIAHHAIGSMFGGGSSSSHGGTADAAGDTGDSDDWEV